MLKRISHWLPEIPDAVIPDSDDPSSPKGIRSSDDAPVMTTGHATGESVIVGDWRIMLSETPLGPPRFIDPDAGAVQLGPIKVSARFSLVLIFWIVVIFNVLLVFGVVVGALIKSGKL